MKNKKAFLVFGVVFTIIIIITASFTLMRSQKAQNLQIGTVEKSEIIQRVTIAGSIAPNRKTLITTPYDGYVKKLHVKIGQLLKKGSPIVSVAESLQSTDPVYPLRSPFEGTVVQINKTEGEFSKQNDAKDFLVRIDDLTKLFVYSKAPEIDLVKIRKGQEAVIKASAILDRTYKGVIKEISLASLEQESWRQSQVEFPVKILVLDADHQIKPGMSAVVDIITSKKQNVLTLKHEFIEKDDKKYAVTLENGTRRQIKVGLQNEEAFEILEGLKQGDRVRQIDFLSLLKN